MKIPISVEPANKCCLNDKDFQDLKSDLKPHFH